MTNYEKFKAKLMQDPEFREGYQQAKTELDVAFKLLEARNEINVSQEELAQRTGIPQSNLSRLESGKHSPTIAMLQKIASGLDCTLHIEFRKNQDGQQPVL